MNGRILSGISHRYL